MRRYTIFDEMKRMQEEMDNLFINIWNEPVFNKKALEDQTSKEASLPLYRKPLTEVCETDKEYIANLEIPGYEKSDIKINLLENGMEVKVEKKLEQKEEDKKKGTYHMERSYFGFYRFFSLPKNVDPEKIEANYKNGILELKIPKKEIKENKLKQITVK